MKRTEYAPTPTPVTTAPAAVADAAHYVLGLAALRQAANAPADGRGAAGRVAQRGRELSGAVAAAMAQASGENGTVGTPGELLAESHLRLVIHHAREYLLASSVAAVETGEDTEKASQRAVAMMRRLADRLRSAGAAR
ncbi:hypothetical protein [Streptomyces sp. NPDC018045]|uniref:hypothetical protein n=1 Tax=unclassified Streptomyces TaxID=2593676 RepID=UPI0037A1F776